MSGLRAAALAALLAGCASVPEEAGFPDVEQAVAERIGARVEWDRGAPVDREAAAAVRSLLGRELEAASAVQVALLNNRRLQAGYAELGVAQADLVEAGLLRNPVFDLELRFSSDGTGLEGSVVQNFLDLFFLPLRKRIAGAAFERAKLEVTGAVLDLAAEVRATFYALQAAEQTRELRETVRLAAEAAHELARRLHEAGNLNDLDLANERAFHEQAKLDLAAAEADVLELRERVNGLLGLWGPDTGWTAARRLPDLPPEETPGAGLEKRAVEQNLALAAIRQEIEIAAGRAGLARWTDLFPEGALGVTTEREFDGTWGVGPAFVLPLPLFNQGQPAAAAARARLRQSQELYYATAVEVRARARAARSRLEAARARAGYFFGVLLPLRQAIVEETQKRVNAMAASLFQLLTARREQIEAGTEYIESLRDYWIARTGLDQILSGRLPPLDGSGTLRGGPRAARPGGHAP